jgi:alkaline phosphatase D
LQVFGIGFNGDQWDGYPAERTRVYNHVLTNNIQNLVVITGDIHSSWANDLPTATYNSSTGAGSAGVEFVTPSVTSPGASIPLGASAIMAANGHIKYVDLNQHGYVIMDINKTRTQADWFYVTTIDNSSTAFSYAKSFYTSTGTRFLKSTPAACLPRNSIYYTKAPFCPRVLATGINTFAKPEILLSVYPNPTFDYITYQYNNASAGNVSVTITDMSGKEVYNQSNEVSQGVQKGYLNTAELANGIYFIKIKTSESSQVFKFVKQ